VLLACSASAGEALSPDDVHVITVSLEHFLNEDLSWVELVSQTDLPLTGRTDIDIAALTDTNMLGFGFVNNPRLDSAAKHHGQTLSHEIKDNLRSRNVRPVSVDIIAEQSVHFSAAPHNMFGLWFADDFPTARAYVVLWLPGYAKDKESALFSFLFGPRHSPSQAFYKLKKSDNGWEIEWHKLTYYL
jgi:hypothetical protein